VSAEPQTEPSAGHTRTLALIALLALALNLRTAVGILGVVLPELRSDLQMSATFGGVLTTVPVLCFAVFGVGAGAVSGRLGTDRTAMLALGLAVLGLAARPFLDNRWAFLILTVVALAGAALGNVMLPALAKRYFADRVPLVSSLYGALVVGGAALSSATTIPAADVLGGWRGGLLVWAGLALVALLPWVALGRHASTAAPTERGWSLRQVARSPLAWLMGGLFGAQAAQAYAQFGWYSEILVDAGLPPGRAGLMLALVSAVSIPLTLVLPVAIRRAGNRPVLPIFYAAITVLGWLVVLVAPTRLALLSAILLGAGSTAFTWVLALIGQRSRTPRGALALSSFVQGLGYLIASLGPFGTGVLHDLTGSWAPPIVGLMVLASVIGILGWILRRPRFLEDDLS
jgi:CP family cyanate transporter-like MFS transporter